MIIYANKSCKICGKTAYDSATGRLVRDHCHKTGLIRGWLCDLCNAYVGILESSHKRKKNKNFRNWYKKQKPRILKHINNRTNVLYDTGKNQIINKEHFLKHLHTRFLCKVCNNICSVTAITEQSMLKLSCGHERTVIIN